MELTKDAPRIYRFGPVFKGLLLFASIGLICMGVVGIMQSYAHIHGLGARFAGVLLSMVPVAAALFVAPMLWRCKLTLHEDRLEYSGILIDTVIRKTDVINALSREPRFGVFSIFLTLAGQPLKSLHIAVLGRMDEAIRSWVDALPHSDVSKA